jgi:general secretion pathway protein G
MNAIRKSQATKVAQNLKSLGTAFENYLYVNNSEPSEITDLGRDIDTAHYGLSAASETGVYYVSVFTDEEADLTTVREALGSATDTVDSSATSGNPVAFGLGSGSGSIFYNFDFQVY